MYIYSKASVNMHDKTKAWLYRNNMSNKDGSIKQPDFLNYGYAEKGEMKLGIKIVAILDLAQNFS